MCSLRAVRAGRPARVRRYPARAAARQPPPSVPPPAHRAVCSRAPTYARPVSAAVCKYGEYSFRCGGSFRCGAATIVRERFCANCAHVRDNARVDGTRPTPARCCSISLMSGCDVCLFVSLLLECHDGSHQFDDWTLHCSSKRHHGSSTMHLSALCTIG